MSANRPIEVIETLRCNFTDEEKLAKGLALAEAHNDLQALDEEEATIKSSMKNKRTHAAAVVGLLAREVSAGFAMRSVKCRIVYDDPNPNEVSYYREDTNELVRTRPLSVTERQADLPLVVNPDPADPAVPAVDAEESQKNIVEFFDKTPDATVAAESEDGQAVDTRTDEEPPAEPVGEIVDADPLGIGVDPEVQRQEQRRSEAAAVRAAAGNLKNM